MVLRSTLLLRMAARAAPKPKYASRPAAAAAQAAMQAPAPQPPPPQPVPPPASANDGSSGGAAGGGLGYQLLLAIRPETDQCGSQGPVWERHRPADRPTEIAEACCPSILGGSRFRAASG
eukprot:gnl/TRDRNA2_/TRDRNA2_39284_c0_seq2.p2 gnl/TRDRNA2_/TRDRNA2_39284_c0~~gnl/TRDRNA2_/TRDRNA2_39284_c0_seq2.p2  ORF type:complete len:120 (+),score=18.46 gnl/TRDRNA2_/TRDRNA2_39284_c0_seq2:90-449(+)